MLLQKLLLTVSGSCVKNNPGILAMKIQKVTPELHAKVYALLRGAFPGSEYQAALVQKLHENGKPLHQWVCLHVNKAIAYIAFSNAYQGKEVCGLHLAPMAVAPEFQTQGVGGELLQFALRQEAIKTQPLFVLGDPGFYKGFGFEPCSQPSSPFANKKAQFLSLRNPADTQFVVGYEPEFKPVSKPAVKPVKPQGKKRR